MVFTLEQLAAFIGAGFIWRLTKPMQLDASALRRSLSVLLYYFLLPLLVFSVVIKLPMTLRTLLVGVVPMVSTAAVVLMTWLWLKRKKGWPAKTKGALLLAATFSNVLFAGIPVMNGLFGPWAQRLAVEYFILGSLPLLIVLGVMNSKNPGLPQLARFNPAQFLLRLPMVWALLAAIVVAKMHINIDQRIISWVDGLTVGVTPLMLMAVGLSLRWSKKWNGIALKIAPAVAMQIVLAPLVTWLILKFAITIPGAQTNLALIVLAGMPATVLGIDVCERYGLDTVAYQIVFTMTAAFSLVTIPLLFRFLA